MPSLSMGFCCFPKGLSPEDIVPSGGTKRSNQSHQSKRDPEAML